MGACSATEVDWRTQGFAGTQRGYLLNGAGLFHRAHRPVDDCQRDEVGLEVTAIAAPISHDSIGPCRALALRCMKRSRVVVI
jgi:hypothetical protein